MTGADAQRQRSGLAAKTGRRRSQGVVRGAGWLAGLTVIVAVLHLLVADAVLRARSPLAQEASTLSRMEVAFVRELRPMAPLAPPTVALTRGRALSMAPGALPSLAALPALAEIAALPDWDRFDESEDEPPVSDGDVQVAAAEPPAADAPSAAQTEAGDRLAGGGGSAEAEAQADEPPAEFLAWPPSTRLSYVLTGNYRGPIDGRARVEWLRIGTRYQVHLDLSIGPPFAPLASRRLSSEGRITEAGLVPQRYEEETRMAFREARQLVIVLGPQQVTLPGGRAVPRPAGVQDSASQFVQMTWLFTTDPTRLRAGHSIELPLALPRRVEPWLYDVLPAETLATPMGPIEAVHVRPRREAQPGGDLTAEFWVAPTLQYLPVRIVIRQSAEIWLDLLLERLPQQADQR